MPRQPAPSLERWIRTLLHSLHREVMWLDPRSRTSSLLLLPSTLSQVPPTFFAGAFLTASLAVMPVISGSALSATSLSVCSPPVRN